MRVLHLSHSGLPDVRVERSAWSSWTAGAEVHFAGPPCIGVALPSDPFSTKSEVKFDLRSKLGEPVASGKLIKRLRRVVAQVKPDVIHAHDIFAGRFAARLGVPFVYDDHEYWSRESLAYMGPADPVWVYKHFLWKSWENEVLQAADAVLTVSDRIAAEHRKRNQRVYVIPNFPRLVEVQSMNEPLSSCSVFTSVYVGTCTPPFVKMRDTSGLVDLFRGQRLGNLRVVGDTKLRTAPPLFSAGRKSHAETMSEMSQCHIGLIPWRKHWFHPYCSPNKAYEYAHAGCLVVTTSSLEQVRQMLPDRCLTFDDYPQLGRLLLELKMHPDELLERRLDTWMFARERLLWDRYDTMVQELYARLLHRA